MSWHFKVAGVLFACIPLSMLGCTYAIGKNNKTYSEKSALIMACYNDADCQRRIAAISYSEHFNANLLWRDPMELYSPEVRKRIYELRH